MVFNAFRIIRSYTAHVEAIVECVLQAIAQGWELHPQMNHKRDMWRTCERSEASNGESERWTLDGFSNCLKHTNRDVHYMRVKSNSFTQLQRILSTLSDAGSFLDNQKHQFLKKTIIICESIYKTVRWRDNHFLYIYPKSNWKQNKL